MVLMTFVVVVSVVLVACMVVIVVIMVGVLTMLVIAMILVILFLGMGRHGLSFRWRRCRLKRHVLVQKWYPGRCGQNRSGHRLAIPYRGDTRETSD
jgi:hypothetical protein